MLSKGNIFQFDGTDQLFNALKHETTLRCSIAKVFTQNLWERTHGYLDSDLANQLSSQFHQRFWEMYLVATLLDDGQELEKGRSEGPDLCILSADMPKIWIEAVTASPGSGADAVQEAQMGVVRSVPDEQIKLRLLTAFDTKFKQFEKYRKKNLIQDDEPYVIAINAAQIPSARLEDDVPRIVSSLLPFGSPIISLSLHTLEYIDSWYAYQGSVSKTSGTGVPTTSFLEPEYCGISAVIYSDVDVLNLPKTLSHGLLMFHNPLAKNPLSLNFCSCGHEYWVDGEELKSRHWNV